MVTRWFVQLFLDAEFEVGEQDLAAPGDGQLAVHNGDAKADGQLVEGCTGTLEVATPQGPRSMGILCHRSKP